MKYQLKHKSRAVAPWRCTKAKVLEDAKLYNAVITLFGFVIGLKPEWWIEGK